MLDLATSFKRIATVNQRSGAELAQHIVIGFMSRANDRVTRDIHRSTWMRTSWHADVVPVFAIEWNTTAEHHSLLAELARDLDADPGRSLVRLRFDAILVAESSESYDASARADSDSARC